MDMVVGLTLYLLKQGYRPGDITVLTPYLKQLANIRVGTLRVDSTIDVYPHGPPEMIFRMLWSMV
jgi:hypothetical protein